MKKPSRNKFCLRPAAGCLSDSRAFTLIELVVVMLVIGILVVLAIEKVAGLAPIRDRMAAAELKVNLRYIRNMAISRERTTRVIFGLAPSNSYSVWVSGTNGIFTSAANPVSRSPWVVNVEQRFPDVELSAVSNIPGNALYFNGANGIPCYNTNSPLTANGEIVFNSGLTVTIAKDTGYVD